LISVQDSYKDELVSVYWGSPPPPEFKKATFIESNYKTELDDLSRLFYRIREYLIDQNNRDLPITDTLLGLHGPKDPGTYTRQHLTNVLKDLGLNDEKKLQDMLLNQKAFYKTLLGKIQYDIQNNPNSAFKDYSNALSGEIGSGKYITEQELELVKRLDDVLNEVLGYVGYTLLKLGFITFDGNEKINFQMPTPTDTQTSREILEKIIRVLGLNSIAEFGTNNIETLLFSMLFSGHYMNLMTIGNDGQIELRKEYTYPGWDFFSDIYSSFTYLTLNPVYHLVTLQTFINSIHISGRFKLLDLNPELEGNAYTPDNMGIGDYGTNKLKYLVYNQDLTFKELEMKFRQQFNLDVKIDNELDIFNTLRQLSGWEKVFDPESGSNVAFTKFKLKFKNGQIKTGYIFAHSRKQFMPGIKIENGEYIIDSEHWANEMYPAFKVDGKDKIYDTERKIILTLLDKFEMNNLIEAEIEIFSEREICASCDTILQNFESAFLDLGDEFKINWYGNLRY